MIPSQAQLEADLRGMITDMPVAVAFGEQVKDCSRTVVSAAEIAAYAGALEGYKFSLHAIKSDWEPLPVDGDLLVVGGEEYRILRSNEDVAGMCWDMGDKYTERSK